MPLRSLLEPLKFIYFHIFLFVLNCLLPIGNRPGIAYCLLGSGLLPIGLPAEAKPGSWAERQPWRAQAPAGPKVVDSEPTGPVAMADVSAAKVPQGATRLTMLECTARWSPGLAVPPRSREICGVPGVSCTPARTRRARPAGARPGLSRRRAGRRTPTCRRVGGRARAELADGSAQEAWGRAHVGRA